VGPQLARKITTKLWRGFGWFVWFMLGLWTALAVFFTIPLPHWLTALLAVGVAALYISTVRERVFVEGMPPFHWRKLRRSLAALAVTGAMLVWFFVFVRPGPNYEWIPKHARMPHVEIDGDKVHVSNVRNFTWRSRTDFDPGYEEHTYDVSKLDSVYYVLSPIFGLDEVAHVWLCFDFSDGQHVAVSVEARLVQGRSFRFIGSMFRQAQLIYVIGDERDVVGLRGDTWGNEVRFFPLRIDKEHLRKLFLDVMERAHSLEEHPEFYNLFTNNCLNNVTYHLQRDLGRPFPSEFRLLLTGYSDRLLYEYGLIDTDLPFEKAHKAYRIDEWIRDSNTKLDDTFSRRLREKLREQGADKVPP
jgi:hypothetical protein